MVFFLRLNKTDYKYYLGFIYFFLQTLAIAENVISIGSVSLNDLPTEITVPVSLSSDQDLTSLNLEIFYDPALLSTEVDQINKLESRFTEFGLENITISVDNTIGVIRWTVAAFLGHTVIPTGNGELLSITFSISEALVAETSLLMLNNVNATDSFINITPFSSVDGEVKGPDEILGFGSFDPFLLPTAIEFFMNYTTKKSLRFLEIEMVLDSDVIETDVIDIEPVAERVGSEADIFYTLDEESGLLKIIVTDTVNGMAILEGAGPILKVNLAPVIDTFCVNTQFEIINAIAIDQSRQLFQPVLQNVTFTAGSPVLVEKADVINILQEGSSTEFVYTVTLRMQPEDDVMITIEFDEEILVSPSILEFTPENWNDVKTVSAMAVDDTIVEGTHTSIISHRASSIDPRFGDVFVCDVAVAITDFAITTEKGWNLMSFPFATERSFADLFSGVLVGNVWRWENTAQQVGLVRLSEFNRPLPFISYWLYTNSQTILEFPGESNDNVATTGQLNEGWNLLGPPLAISNPYNENNQWSYLVLARQRL